MPVPSTPCVCRARFAWWATSPWEVLTDRVPTTDASFPYTSGRRLAGLTCVNPSIAVRIDRISLNSASLSTASSGSRARMARYFPTLLITVPPSFRICTRTSGVTSARMSTVTTPSETHSNRSALSKEFCSPGCPRAVRRASSRSELSFFWVGVRCCFSSSSATIWRTVLSDNPPSAGAFVSWETMTATRSGIAATVLSNFR